MSIVKHIIESFSKNQENMSKVQGARMLNVINQYTGLVVSDQIKENRKPPTVDEEEFWAITLSAEVAGLKLQDDMDAEERALTEQCIGLYDIMGDEKIPERERDNAAVQLRKVYPKLGKVRRKLDEAVMRHGSISDKAEIIIKNCKTPYYSTTPSKRAYNKFDKTVAGIEDPFHDELEKLYPGKGLEGYREENKDRFKDVSDSDMKMASQRYKKVIGFIDKVKNLLEIPILLGAFHFYPDIAQGLHPIAYGFLVYLVSTAIMELGSNSRNSFNKKVFEARDRIADDLGLTHIRLR